MINFYNGENTIKQHSVCAFHYITHPYVILTIDTYEFIDIQLKFNYAHLTF